MQTELLNRRKWKTRVELSTEIFDWIEVFYNRVRRHSSIGMQSPISLEKLYQQLITAARTLITPLQLLGVRSTRHASPMLQYGARRNRN